MHPTITGLGENSQAECLPSIHEAVRGFSHQLQNDFIDRERCLLGWLKVTVLARPYLGPTVDGCSRGTHIWKASTF